MRIGAAKKQFMILSAIAIAVNPLNPMPLGAETTPLQPIWLCSTPLGAETTPLQVMLNASGRGNHAPTADLGLFNRVGAKSPDPM
jgi:hypothetical protein